MNKLLLALAVALLGGGAATADVPAPPPPKGQKYVDVSSEVKVAKDVSGYVFVLQAGHGPGRPEFKYERLELNEKTAKRVSGGGKYSYVSLLAVPEDAAKAFKTDAELFAALDARKVKGAHSVGMGSVTTVPDTIEGSSVTRTYTITGIDDKGIKTKVEGEGMEKKEKQPGPVGLWVAGGAAALAVMLGGLWAVGRTRRRV